MERFRLCVLTPCVCGLWSGHNLRIGLSPACRGVWWSLTPAGRRHTHTGLETPKDLGSCQPRASRPARVADPPRLPPAPRRSPAVRSQRCVVTGEDSTGLCSVCRASAPPSGAPRPRREKQNTTHGRRATATAMGANARGVRSHRQFVTCDESRLLNAAARATVAFACFGFTTVIFRF